MRAQASGGVGRELLAARGAAAAVALTSNRKVRMLCGRMRTYADAYGSGGCGGADKQQEGRATLRIYTFLLTQ